jgi:hypothetical protein
VSTSDNTLKGYIGRGEQNLDRVGLYVRERKRPGRWSKALVRHGVDALVALGEVSVLPKIGVRERADFILSALGECPASSALGSGLAVRWQTG